MDKRIKLYVSIPYTGYEDNFEVRCKDAKAKYSMDYLVVTPKDVIRDSATPYETCMGKCIEALLMCDEAVFADGWADSRGCNLEMQACIIYNKPYKTDSKI